MGRANARPRRQGTSSLRPPATNTVFSVLIDDFAGGKLQVLFNQELPQTQYTPNLFLAGPTMIPADSVIQLSTLSLQYTAAAWASAIFVGDPWEYLDEIPAIVSPQTGLIS